MFLHQFDQLGVDERLAQLEQRGHLMCSLPDEHLGSKFYILDTFYVEVVLRDGQPTDAVAFRMGERFERMLDRIMLEMNAA